MSKRSNRQLSRRQQRRALNRIGDSLTQIGTRRAMRFGYGTGITQHVARTLRERNVSDSYKVW